MDDYITVVEVDDPTSKDTNHSGRHQAVKRNNSIQDSSFITVLSINDVLPLTQTTSIIHTNAATDNNRLHENNNNNNNSDIESVLVYRLPGERLGFGLKFQGGTRSSERVQRLFIQSCAKDSPASRVEASWGNLREGDEIVSIDGKAVCEMTRIDCVRCLKDNVAIKLIVRNGYGQLPTGDGSGEEESRSTKMSPPPPPPVPPRKLVKRRQFRDGKTATVDEKPFTPPPDAEYYINLFSDENSLKAAGSESDDTASTISTISTVIDRFSIGSSYSSETDLSTFSSMNGNSVMNKAELAKVLKPFTMLEKEFKIGEAVTKNDDGGTKTPTAPPANNYENIDLKVEKLNVYENVELKLNDSTDGVEKNNIPAPKPRPRQIAIVEPKKRSILPTPRKFNGIKLEVQESVESPKLEDSKLITKIPKAIAAVFGSSSPKVSMERSKTESELKLNQHSRSTSDLRKQCERFLESEVKSSQENLAMEKQPSEDTKSGKSKIPVVLSPKRSIEMEAPPKIETILIKPRTMVQKQKSETDLKLTSYRPKDQRPTNLPILKTNSPAKPTLQRSNSADSKARENSSIKSPERTLIPVLNQSPSSEAGSPTKAKGPKPKPPERVQSLTKTQIPKLHQAGSQVVSPSNTTQVIVNNLEPTMIPVTPPTPTMQTFKQSSPPLKAVSSPPQNREIKFKIQTYESSQLEKDKEREKSPFTDVNSNEESVMPSLFDLVRKNSPSSPRKDETHSSKITTKTLAEDSKNFDKNPESPVIVKKCIKITNDQPQTDTYYSSSSSGSSDDDDEDGCVDEKEYEIEDGEKLGPPELVNGPGPSEAYFNMYWHSNMLPTIGEVEEEFSSMELQQVSNGPIVIVNDVIQNQQPKQQQQQHQESSNKQKKPPSAAEITANFIKAETINVTKNDDKNPKSISSAITLPNNTSSAVKTSTFSHNKSNDDSQTNEPPPAFVNETKNTDSENADDKISDIDSSKTTTIIPHQVEECETSSNTNDNDNTKTNVIETTISLIAQKSHPQQVNATNCADNEISTRDSSISKGVSEKLSSPSLPPPEVSPIEMNQSDDSQLVVGRTITKSVKTVTTQKTVKSSQKIESFEQIDGNNPETPEISVINKSESNEESSSSVKLVEEVKIPADLNAIPIIEPLTKLAVMEETFKSDKIASRQIIERQDEKEHIHQSVECQSEQNAIKATIKETSKESPVLSSKNPATKDGITVTVSTETRLIEVGENDDVESDDRQSIVTGILSLSESGIRTKETSNQIEVVECKHEKQEGFAEIDLVRDLKKKEGLSSENRKSLEAGEVDLESAKKAEGEKMKKNLMEEETPIVEKKVENVLDSVNEDLVVEEVHKLQNKAPILEKNVEKVQDSVNEDLMKKDKAEEVFSETVKIELINSKDENSLPVENEKPLESLKNIESEVVFEKCKLKEKQSETSETLDEVKIGEPKEVDLLQKIDSEPVEATEEVEKIITFEKCKPKAKNSNVSISSEDIRNLSNETAIETLPETPKSVQKVESIIISDIDLHSEGKSVNEIEKLTAEQPKEVTEAILEDRVLILEQNSTPLLSSAEDNLKLDEQQPIINEETTVIIEEIQTKTDSPTGEVKDFEEIFNNPDPAPLYVLRKNIIHCDPPKQNYTTEKSCSKLTETSILSDLPKDLAEKTLIEEISTEFPKIDIDTSTNISSKDKQKQVIDVKHDDQHEKASKKTEEKLPSKASEILKSDSETNVATSPVKKEILVTKSATEDKTLLLVDDTQMKKVPEAEILSKLEIEDELPISSSTPIKNKSDSKISKNDQTKSQKLDAKSFEEILKVQDLPSSKIQVEVKTPNAVTPTRSNKNRLSLPDVQSLTLKQPETKKIETISTKEQKTPLLKKSKSDADSKSLNRGESKPREFTAKIINVMKKTPIDSKDSRIKSMSKSSPPPPTEVRIEPNGLECKTIMPTTAAASVHAMSVQAKPKPMERIILGVEHNPDGHAKSSNEFQSKVKTTTKTTTSESQAGPEASKSSTSTGPSSSLESTLTPKTTTSRTTPASLANSTSSSSLSSSSSGCPADVNEEKGLLTHYEDKQGE